MLYKNSFLKPLTNQGADSCELVSFCGLLNQTEENRTDWIETGQEKAAIFRRGTNALGQKFLENRTNRTKTDSHFQEGYELFQEEKKRTKRTKTDRLF